MNTLQTFWENRKTNKPGGTTSTIFFVATLATLIPGLYMFTIPVSAWALTMGAMLFWKPSWTEAAEPLRKWWWWLTVFMAPFAAVNQIVSTMQDPSPMKPISEYLTPVIVYIMVVFATVLLSRNTWRLPVAVIGSLALTVYAIPGLTLNFINGWYAVEFALPWWVMTVFAGIGLLAAHTVRLVSRVVVVRTTLQKTLPH